MQIFTIINAITKILSDPNLQALAAKFVEWFQSLTPAQQLAEAQLYEGYKGFGCPFDPDCDGGPDCPDELKPVREALMSACQG